MTGGRVEPSILPTFQRAVPALIQRVAMLILSAVLIATAANAQWIDDDHGDPRQTRWGVMDGNRVRTLFANHGEIARWPDQPSGEWPAGSGHSYVDGVALIVSARTRDAEGRTIYPMSTNYREFMDLDPITKIPWGWAPVPGYAHPRSDSPARSDDDTTWPAEWPDRPIDWAGRWNGWFGRGVQNADVETYFVFDDAPDHEWTGEPHRFLPCPDDPDRGGLGLQVRARGFQWSHVLAQDVIFWLYEITNECAVDYEEVYFAQYIDWGVGGTDDSGDDEGAYNTRLDLAFAWDSDGVGSPGQWGPVGTAGYAFLESPGISNDGVDNDEDGIIDESRTSGPGQLIEGQEAIRQYVESVYDMQNFERFYGALEDRPAFIAGRWWTGDEDMDWRGFEDLNENGVWDEDEPLYDDVGEDGLGPNDPDYPGRDIGEGDGIPTPGEPNFDGLDKDESDQIGLTGFAVFDVHRYELIDDAQNFRIFSQALPPLDDIVLEGGRNLGMFFSSGPFPLASGQTERFSMALLFAEKDFNNPREIENSALARKKETVQQIYNADYRFARPPDKPTLTAVPGDGQVTLIWDDAAERSFDPFLQEHDFEGYLVYRSTEPNFRENLIITDAYGNASFQRPLAQFDLVNGLRGPHPVSVNGLQFNLGTDSGIRRTYVDRDVRNGQTYYYAIVAYDRGVVARDENGNVMTEPGGLVQGIAPSLTTATIKNDIAGNIITDINTAEVTPRAPAAGYVPPSVSDFSANVRGTGSVDIQILSPAVIAQTSDYELRFENESAWQNAPESTYRLVNRISGDIVDEGVVSNGNVEIPPVEGFSVTIEAPTEVSVNSSSIGYTGEGGTYFPVVLPATVSNVVNESRFVALPHDFEIHFTDAPADTSLRLAFGQREIPTPFYIQNRTTGERQPFILSEDVDSLSNGVYDHGDLIILVMGVEPGEAPAFEGGRWRASWAVRLIPPDPELESEIDRIPPAPGSSLVFSTNKPFQTDDVVRWTVQPPEFDEAEARSNLSNVYVVPNPYVATSVFEPSNVYTTGRGERRIYFMNLPPECTIRIYTVSGQLVQTLHHQSTVDDGQLAWDLVTKDGMNAAYGVYIYHVDAPGVGEHTGRFALIK